MEWTDTNEDILKEIAMEAEVFYLCHNESFRKYKTQSYFYIIPTIVLSSIIGGISFNEEFNSNSTNKMVLASLNIFIAILNALFKILNIDDYITQYFYLSKMWYLLYEKIRIELSKAPNDRVSCNLFLEECIQMKITLLEKNTILSKNVIKKYKNKYKTKLELPLALSHLLPIKIYNRNNGIQTPLTPSPNVSIIDYSV